MRHSKLLRNESYPEEANLTEEQTVYNRLWKDMGGIQRGSARPDKIALGFKPRPFGKSVQPLDPDRPIRDLDSVLAVMMIPIPTEHWRGAPPTRRYRFHTTELSATMVDGEIVFNRPGQQFDFGKSPYQDHQVYRLASFDPGSVGAEIERARLKEVAREEAAAPAPLSEEEQAEEVEIASARMEEFERDGAPVRVPSIDPQQEEEWESPANSSVLISPLSGDMVTIRDDLFVSILIGRTTIYRFPLDAGVEFVPDGEIRRGDPVVTLIEKQTYQVAELKDCGRPKMDLIGPDVLSASRFVPLFRLCNSLLGGIVNGIDPYYGDEPIPVKQAAKLLPKLLAVFPLEEGGENGDWVEAIRASGAFEASGELKKQILAAVQPGGDFGIVAPVTGTFTGVDDFGAYKQVNFLSEDSEQVVTLMLPKCSVLHGPFTENKSIPVTKGDTVGDWIARDYYPDYFDLGDHAESGLVAIESAYLRSQVIVTGEKGFEDDGVAVDARLVESVLDSAESFKLDFSGVLEAGSFFHPQDGTVGPILLKVDHTQVGNGICTNGIRYSPPLRGYTEKPEKAARRHGSSNKHVRRDRERARS